MTYGRTFKLDDDGDLSITSERIDLVEGDDKIIQDMRVLFQTVIGENILHLGFGFLKITEDKSFFTEKGLEAQARITLDQYHYELVVNKVTVTLDITNRTASIGLELTLKSGVKLEVFI